MAKETRRKKSKSYSAFLKKELQDPELAADYLSAAIQDGDLDGFLLALRGVADAHGGIGAISKLTRLNRQSMYKMFSEDGNPTVSSLLSILDVLGISISFSPQEKKRKRSRG